MSNEPEFSSQETQPAESAPLIGYAAPHVAGDLDQQHLTRGDIAALAVRIIGVYTIVQAILTGAGFISFAHADWIYLAGAAIRVGAIAGLGVFLTASAPKVARWLLPRTAVVATDLPGHGPAQMQAIALSVMGVYLFVSAAPTLGYKIVMMMVGNAGQPIQYGVRDTVIANLPRLVPGGVETLLGVWLFFGSKRIAAWWWSLRRPEFVEAPAEVDSKHTP